MMTNTCVCSIKAGSIIWYAFLFQMSYKRTNTTATARLKQDYMRIMKDPIPYVKAIPLPSNILEW